MSNDRKVEMYYITSFKQFDRKVYQLFGKKIGRAIPFKSIAYFIIIAMIVWILRHIPLLSLVFLKVPFLVSYLLTPLAGSYLLSDVESEDRTVLAYLRSMVYYHVRKMRNKNFYRGNLVNKPQVYKVNGHASLSADKEASEEYKGNKYKMKGLITYR